MRTRRPVWYHLIGIALAVAFDKIVSAQHEGDSCNHTLKGIPGFCKRLDQCSVAIQDLQSGVHPQSCCFVDNVLIVCCPPEITTITTTTPAVIELTTIGKLPVGEKSRQACERYKMLAYNSSSSLNDENELIDICPWKHGGVAVAYDGKLTEEGEFPHMALIGYDRLSGGDGYGWYCGGSLISEKYVLTSAHCRQTGDSKAKVVRLGDLDYADPDDDQYVQEINVKNITLHPLYKRSDWPNDIALVELEHPAQLNIHVKPICLYRWNPIGKVHSGMITSWGYTEFDVQNQNRTSKLLKGGTQNFGINSCKAQSAVGPLAVQDTVDPEVHLCFGPKEKKHVDTCLGDIGVPLQIYNKDVYCSYYVFGILIKGSACGLLGRPSLYTNLYPFIEWIENIVWP